MSSRKNICFCFSKAKPKQGKYRGRRIIRKKRKINIIWRNFIDFNKINSFLLLFQSFYQLCLNLSNEFVFETIAPVAARDVDVGRLVEIVCCWFIRLPED